MKLSQREDTTVDTEEAAAATEPARTAGTGSGAAGTGWPGKLARIRGLARTGRGRAALVITVLVLLGASAGGYYWNSAGQLPSGVALRVGTQDVTVSQLQSEAGELHAMYGVQQPSGKAKAGQFWRSMAQADALRIILGRVARSRNIVISDKQAQDVVTRFVTTEYGNSSDAQAQFLAALGNVGVSQQEVLTEIKLMLAENQLYRQVTSGVKVTGQQVRQAFAQRRARLGTPARRDISNIVVGSQSEAAAVVKELSRGANFASLAKRVSLDDSTRGSGGNIGTVSASQLDSGYAKAAFAAPLHGVFGPVHTSSGWNVGEVTKILPPVPATFSAVSGTLGQELKSEKATAVWVKWLTRQIRNARVRYADKYRPAHPDAVPSTPQLSGPSAQPSAPPAP